MKIYYFSYKKKKNKVLGTSQMALSTYLNHFSVIKMLAFRKWKMKQWNSKVTKMLNVPNPLVSIHDCSEEKGKAEPALASLGQLKDDPPDTIEFGANFSQPRRPGNWERLKLPLSIRLRLLLWPRISMSLPLLVIWKWKYAPSSENTFLPSSHSSFLS